MEIEAKHQISCDSCKKAIVVKSGKTKADPKAKKVIEPLPVEAVFHDGMGEEKNYHFCDEECLRIFLNGRRKNAKASFELDIVNNAARKFVEDL